MHSCRNHNRSSAVAAVLLALGLALMAGAVGCGGGGGGGTPTQSGNVTVLGTVLDAESLAAPSSGAITINGKTANTAADGTFQLTNVAATATTATVTASGEQPRTLTLKIPAKTTSLDLGDIYMSATGYNASASGTVVTPKSGANQPVGGATVTIAGTSVLTGTDGTFSIPNLPVGLGTDPTTPIGTVHATGFVDKPIVSQFVFTAGDNPLGALLIQTPVNSTAPPPPYTVSGQVTHSGTAQPNVTVAIFSGATQLGTAQTDANGTYYFWVVPGNYTVITVLSGGQQVSVSVQLNAPNTPVTAPPLQI
jgi:hypothetical protein